MSGSSPKRLSEADLKCLYLQHMQRHGLIDDKSTIASEYLLGHTGRRVDLAILSDVFIGIEFKSASDSLKRLKPQLDAYVACFDQVVLVADSRHITKARSILPSSVELWSVNASGTLSLVQRATASTVRTARALAQLCNTRQLRKLAPVPDVANLSRSKLVDATTGLPFETIRAAAVESFSSSFSASSATFWSSFSSDEVNSEALAGLSRFAQVKIKRQSALARQNEFWKRWAEEAASVFGDVPRQVAGTI